MPPTLIEYLALSAFLLGVGLYGLISKRNLIRLLIAIEIMFNAANLNLVAFNTYASPMKFDGHILVLFAIAIAAAEAVIGLSLAVSIYRTYRTINVREVSKLKG